MTPELCRFSWLRLIGLESDSHIGSSSSSSSSVGCMYVFRPVRSAKPSQAKMMLTAEDTLPIFDGLNHGMVVQIRSTVSNRGLSRRLGGEDWQKVEVEQSAPPAVTSSP
ncbi:uncharacterized protein BP01DRAFT_360101 [Aspergillus saccharolyticus JOP 1030-1]|uniref:Uncharacterized protein n=1 Tax=Aspergillus saccharolyticus JOP 1030-1 TaxID=1450539 RepID=A0A318Z3A5_9EURO|nr:hypothetical protein BP01DRAFT_360101 [Aspergillus saccharolyticus JOP 1030-1]PYH41755.1 hypothetical protein BP01DRAFT_360101 [Aspergillus saccharolyticus JOP 1030-1]